MKKGKSVNKKSKSKKNKSNNSSKNVKNVNKNSNKAVIENQVKKTNNKNIATKNSETKVKEQPNNSSNNKASSSKVNITNNHYKMVKQNNNIQKIDNKKKSNSSKKNNKTQVTSKKKNAQKIEKKDNSSKKSISNNKIKYTQNKTSNKSKVKKDNLNKNNNLKQKSKDLDDIKNNKDILPKNDEHVDSNDKKENNPKKEKKVYDALLISCLSIILIFLINVALFLNNYLKTSIQKNIFIDNIDVSNLNVEEAEKMLDEKYEKILTGTLKYRYENEEYVLALNDIDLEFLINDSVKKAVSLGRSSNIISDIKNYYKLLFGYKENIDLNYKYDEKKLQERITEIEANFYKEVVQSSYTTDGDILSIKNGVEGISINKEKFVENVKNIIECKNIPDIIEIPIVITKPDPIDVDKIHSEIYVNMENASYSIKPFEIHNEVRGVDFDKNAMISMIEAEPEKEEYILPLAITNPEITVDMLDLYNDVLGTCRTTYINNPNRTTNLRLAASKIDGFILMPGETFSYNEIVGERTYSAGYRNAAIYVNGEVEDGLAGRNLSNFINII